jgi:hypothetical protein
MVQFHFQLRLKLLGEWCPAEGRIQERYTIR